MKKFVAVLSAAAMLATLAACGSTAATTSTATSSADTAAASSSEAAAADDTAKSYKIAVVQQLDHASLDEIRTAVEAELDAKAAEKGITIEYKDFNGQNDATTLNQIGTQVVSDGYDAVVPIATLAAQCMANACAEDQIPVVYAAISDPAAADLTGLDYVTGTSDALNTQFILDMMLAINPDVRGWLTIDGTHVDYPIVQGEDDMEYVNKGVYGEFSLSGTIFLDSENTSDFSDCYNLLFGHHMANGAMFGDVVRFTDRT